MSTKQNDKCSIRYEYKISFRLWHPFINPQIITETLSIKPFHSCQVGMPRSTPKGTPLKGINCESFWTGNLEEGSWPPVLISASISNALSKLTDHRAFLQQIRAEGGRAEFFIGWFFNTQSGDTFPHDLLARTSDLGIDLSFDVYRY